MGERKTRAMRKKNPNSIWIIIRLLFRQRLTAGALVCVTNSTCVLLTSRAGLHLCTSRPQARILKQQTLLCLRRNAEQHCIFFFSCLFCLPQSYRLCFFFFLFLPPDPQHPLCLSGDDTPTIHISHTCTEEPGVSWSS